MCFRGDRAYKLGCTACLSALAAFCIGCLLLAFNALPLPRIAPETRLREILHEKVRLLPHDQEVVIVVTFYEPFTAVQQTENSLPEAICTLRDNYGLHNRLFSFVGLVTLYGKPHHAITLHLTPDQVEAFNCKHHSGLRLEVDPNFVRISLYGE